MDCILRRGLLLLRTIRLMVWRKEIELLASLKLRLAADISHRCYATRLTVGGVLLLDLTAGGAGSGIV